MGVSGGLAPSERVLWTGSPVRYPLFDRADLLRVPFLIIWFGFGIFWEYGVTTMTTVEGGPRYGPFFRILGAAILAIGVCSVVGKLVADQVRLRHTVYTLTDRSVAVKWTIFGAVRSNTRKLRDLGTPRLTESSNGVGTIRFGRNDIMFMGTGRRMGGLLPITLREIEDARLVLAAVDQARTNSD